MDQKPFLELFPFYKQQITINLNVDTIDYFKDQSEETGIPYQTLINLYLSECAAEKKKLQMSWV